MQNSAVYDLIIVGAGPAGLTASIYASCYHLKHLVIGKELGGQLQFAPDILNFPGFESISGKELTARMLAQAKNRGGELVTQSVTGISIIPSTGPATQVSQTTLQNPPIAIGVKASEATFEKLSFVSPVDSSAKVYEVETQDGKKYQAKAIILATGTERRKLNVPGEVEYTGRGVHYCATCEKLDYAGKKAAVVGGANSAVQAAVELAQAAEKVYIIYRGTALRGDPIWLEQIEKNDNIEVIYSSVVTEIVGDGEKVRGVKIQTTDNRQQLTNNPITQSANNPINENNETMKSRPKVGIHDVVITPPIQSGSQTASGQWNNKILTLDKIFIEIGGVPGTALVIPLGVKMDQGGYIEVNERLATNVAGIFAAGDLVSYGLSIEQISSAVGLGARAASSAFAFIKQEKAPTVWGGSRINR